MKALEEVLLRASEEAEVLHRNGYVAHADSITRLVAAVRLAAGAVLEWIPEQDAQLRSGFGPDYFRARRAAWAADGLAEKRASGWFYCRLIVPQRKLESISRAERQRGGRR